MVFRVRTMPCLFSVLLFLFASHIPLHAAGGPAALAAVHPVMSCDKLAAADLSTAVGAPTHITAATAVHDGKPAPYCDVQGFVEPAIKFEIRLPLEKWTQRYMQTGCGGLCGDISIRLSGESGCMPATNGELVLAATDMGHQGGMDGAFGAEDDQLRIDFAYRSEHVTALAAKALIARFYGQAPKFSYFAGCSDGGREALMEAQRYPDDFNGITAGAPAMNFITQNTFYHGWNVLANRTPDGKSILTADKLPVLHRAALEQCDALDGLKDGLISNPFACTVDPSKVECATGKDAPDCLTHAQVVAARELYRGAHDAEGNQLTLSGPMPGSELAWEGVLIAPPGMPFVLSEAISSGALKNLVYDPNPANFNLKDLKFDRATFEATTRLHGLYDSTDTDLSAFSGGGGKLILWHGLADPHISPLNTVAYYTALQKQMGADKVEQFARLYLFPGGYHCADGEGPFEFGLLQAIMSWVESGQRPNELVAKHLSGGQTGPVAGVPAGVHLPPPGEHPKGMPEGMPPMMGPGAPSFPMDGPPPNGAMPAHMPAVSAAPGKVDRTRPVYPYPFVANYAGSGSIDEAKNFVQGPAQPVSPERLHWLGERFYAAHYELWCQSRQRTMSCQSKEAK